eukprot:2947892-Alexandrium_andersonii.AAC.1
MAPLDDGGPRSSGRGGHATLVAPPALWGPLQVQGGTLPGPHGRSMPCPDPRLDDVLLTSDAVVPTCRLAEPEAGTPPGS